MKKGSLVKRFDRWHKTKVGLLVTGLLELVASYIFLSRAIDTGSGWEYAFALIFLVGGIHNFVRLIRKK